MTNASQSPKENASTGRQAEPAARERVGLGELGQRLVWGLVLAAAALGLTFWGTVPFAGLVLAVALLMAWEWGRIVRGRPADVAFSVHAAAVAVAIVLVTLGYPALGLLTVVIGAILAGLLSFGVSVPMSAVGVLYVGLPALVLVGLRREPEFGLKAVLFLFLVVWAADTGAYAAGRLIGGPKLWPRVSPNKTWAGLLGAMTASGVVGAVFAVLAGKLPVLGLALSGVLLAVVAQAGDLAESALKRRHGVKDASALIPGHGGFLDRVDGLVFAAVAAALVALAVDIHAPARARLPLW